MSTNGNKRDAIDKLAIGDTDFDAAIRELRGTPAVELVESKALQRAIEYKETLGREYQIE